MKFLFKVGILLTTLALLYIFAEGVVSFDANFELGDKMFGVMFKTGIREIPKTVNIIP